MSEYWVRGDDPTSKEFHRTDGPAVVYEDGSWEWYLDGQLHRDDDEPAVLHENGEQIWYWRGKMHRQGGPADIAPDGEAWFLNGKLHREDGPADTSGGEIQYALHGQHHRLDGPAYVQADGTELFAWHGQFCDSLATVLEYEGDYQERLARESAED